MAVEASTFDDRPAEVTVEHNPEQTLVAVETQDGSAVAAVDVGHLPLDETIQLAKDVREAFEAATQAGGEDGV